MPDAVGAQHSEQIRASPLDGPAIIPDFVEALDELIAVARKGHASTSEFFNPTDEWLISHMRIFQDLPEGEQIELVKEYEQIRKEAEVANALGKAAQRAGPDVAFRLDSGGLAFFSQLGVARRPDLTQYFIEGFPRNRDAVAFSETNQTLFAQIWPYLTRRLEESFARGDTVVQTDRRICDAPGRSFHARLLLHGTRYLQLPYMWRQLTFDLPEQDRSKPPDILEVSFPRWLEEGGLPDDLTRTIREAGLTQLVFKAPTKRLSLHLGFDYMGEHKMGPLSIAMFLVKQANGLALQAALSMVRVRTLNGKLTNTALVTAGPSLHGKSTLTIMIDPNDSQLSRLLGLVRDPDEGIYPMNDDIVLLQPLGKALEARRDGGRIRIFYGIDGTENNFYAVPFGLAREDDPITYDVLRGSEENPNRQETLENVVIKSHDGSPDYLQNPVRNMRMILSRSRLLSRKVVQDVLGRITNGHLKEGVHIPMDETDRVFWQAVMRENTVVPPLQRLRLEQYVRALMYGEAIQMGAAAGAIGKPYIEYFSDPFIIGLEDDNANLLYHVLRQMEHGGLRQEYYVFNTGGIGAETSEETSGPRYKKIPKELTLMLQEALLRDAVRFEHDPVMGADVVAAIVNLKGEEVLDLRREWLPFQIYGEAEYTKRVVALRRKRYYGRGPDDRAGILRYTKVTEALLDLADIPLPANERELAWLLSFYWQVEMAYHSLPALVAHLAEGSRPLPHLMRALQKVYEASLAQGLKLSDESCQALRTLDISNGG